MSDDRSLDAKLAAAGLLPGRRYWLSFAAASIGLLLFALDPSRTVGATAGGLFIIVAGLVTFAGYRKHPISWRELVVVGPFVSVFADWFGRALLLVSLLRRR
jgi:hypothetical protein